MTGGFSVIVALAVLLVSAWLVAVTVTVCRALKAGGAVKSPAVLIVLPVPAGLIDHVTVVFGVPVTTAVNCCVWPAVTVLVAGATDMATGGFSAIVAAPVFVLSAWLVAVTVTVCCDAIVAGAV